MVSIPLSVIINLVKYPLPSPPERHELSAKFQTCPLGASRRGGESTSSYLLNQTSTLTPSTGRRPFCTFNKFKQFSDWVGVSVKCFNNRGDEHSGPLSPSWLMGDVRPPTAPAAGSRRRLMHCWENLRRSPAPRGRGLTVFATLLSVPLSAAPKFIIGK